MQVCIRLLCEADAPVLTGLLQANRDFLTPWEPARNDDYFTVDRQRRDVADALTRHESGTVLPCVILHGDDLVGRITINDIVRGAFQSAHLGYWVAEDHSGSGVATAAAAAAVRLAFTDLHLHRLQADTLVHNVASQKVLLRNGFTRIGLAPRYLRIAGRWQDNILHQLLNDQPATDPASAGP